MTSAQSDSLDEERQSLAAVTHLILPAPKDAGNARLKGKYQQLEELEDDGTSSGDGGGSDAALAAPAEPAAGTAGTAGTMPTIFNSVKSYIGTGVMSMPFAYSRGGLLLTPLGILLVSICSNYSVREAMAGKGMAGKGIAILASHLVSGALCLVGGSSRMTVPLTGCQVFALMSCRELVIKHQLASGEPAAVVTLGSLGRQAGGPRAGALVDGFLVFTQIGFCIACAQEPPSAAYILSLPPAAVALRIPPPTRPPCRAMTDGAGVRLWCRPDLHGRKPGGGPSGWACTVSDRLAVGAAAWAGRHVLAAVPREVWLVQRHRDLRAVRRPDHGPPPPSQRRSHSLADRAAARRSRPTRCVPTPRLRPPTWRRRPHSRLASGSLSGRSKGSGWRFRCAAPNLRPSNPGDQLRR